MIKICKCCKEEFVHYPTKFKTSSAKIYCDYCLMNKNKERQLKKRHLQLMK